MKNLGLKLWSLIIALLVAYYVNSQQNSGVITIVLPVELQNVPRHKVLVEPHAPQIQVTLRGPSYLLSDIASRPPTVKVALPENFRKEMTYHGVFRRDQLGLPPAVEVLVVQPAYMDFIFDNLAEKTVPVVVPRIGQLPRGYILEKVIVTPRKLLIKGAEKEVDRLSSIETYPLNLSDLRQDTELTLRIRTTSRNVQVNANEVRVTVKVRPVKHEKRFDRVSVQVKFRNFKLPSSSAVKLTPPFVAVEISGSFDDLRSLKPSDVIPYVVLKEGVNNGDFLKVRLRLPSKIDLVFIDPPKVKVSILTEGGKP